MRSNPGRRLVAATLMLVCLGAARSARGDEALLDDLSAMRANRLSGLRNVSVTGQVNVGFPSAGRTQSVLTLALLWPFPLGASWQLLTYTVGEIVSQPGLESGDGRVVGLGDTVLNAVVTPKRTGALYWGVGPVLQLPTATNGDLGSRDWAAGPSLALFVQPLPWTVGALLENAWGRQFNQFSAQYWVNYNLPRGWFLESNATPTADWEGPLADRWTVPLAGGFGKVFTLAGQGLSASAQGSYNVKEPRVGGRLVAPAPVAVSIAAMTCYLISDLHIGGDGGLDRCEFERELIEFLADIAAGPQPAELVIVGDAFGFWELTDRDGVSKLETIAATHPDLFRQLHATGERVTITLLPGNHDYDLACVPAYAAELARYNVRLEPRVSITRTIAGRTIWIEHGNQHDDFNRFPDFGNRWALPLGYFVTRRVVAAAGQTAARTTSKWLDDVESVYPNEDIPFWVLSNHFYKDMTPWLRWGILPFLLLFTVSAAIFGLRAVEQLSGWRTGLFEIDLQPILGFPGRIIDLVQFVNSTVVATLLVLAVPLWFLLRDLRATLLRYGIARGDALHPEKDEQYVAAARRVFAADPSVAAFIYGHTHIPSQREVDGRLVINTGTWLKRLEYVPVRLGRLPGVYVPSYRLNWFQLDEHDGALRVRYRMIPKKAPNDLTWLERLLILGREPTRLAAVPAETRLAGEVRPGPV